MRFLCWLLTGHGRRWRFGHKRRWLVVREGRARDMCRFCGTLFEDHGPAEEVIIGFGG